MLYDKILVAVDGSQQSNRALKEAVRIAKFINGTITLIHVYSRDPSSSQLISASQQLSQILKDNGEAALEAAKKLVSTECETVNVDTILLEGDAAEKIVETAHNGSFDLVVLGARGLSKLSGLILGSVSQGVIKNSPCPILIVK
jgi:nucleotide-binding universal stress UspA family protein